MVICEILAKPTEDDTEETHAIAEAWNQLDKHSQRATLPTILTRAVFQMSATEITLDLVDSAAKIIGEAIEVECE